MGLIQCSTSESVGVDMENEKAFIIAITSVVRTLDSSRDDPQTTATATPMSLDSWGDLLDVNAKSETNDTPFLTRITSEEMTEPFLSRITSSEWSDNTEIWPPTTNTVDPLTTLSVDNGRPSDKPDPPAPSSSEASNESSETGPPTSTATSESSTASTSTATPSPTESAGVPAGVPPLPDQDKLSNGATAGIVIGVVVVLLTAIMLGRWIYNKKKKGQHRRDGLRGQQPRDSTPRQTLRRGHRRTMPISSERAAVPASQEQSSTWPRGDNVELQTLPRAAMGA